MARNGYQEGMYLSNYEVRGCGHLSVLVLMSVPPDYSEDALQVSEPGSLRCRGLEGHDVGGLPLG